MSAPKLERLLNLIALLLDTDRALTADEIQQSLEAYPDDLAPFRRAFERDKEELRAMGIPLRMVKVMGRGNVMVDGYDIPQDEYRLRDPGLTPEEVAALHLAASAVQVEGLSAGGAFAKLGGVAGGAGGGSDLGVRVAPLPADANLSRLFLAVSSRTPVELSYHGEARTVDPHRVEFQRGRWYLSGFDHLRGEARSYRLDRIEGDVTLTDLPAFARPDHPSPGQSRPAWELGAEDPVSVVLRIDGPPARWARYHLPPDSVSEIEPGVVQAVLPVTNRAALRSFVLSFLEHAEVIEPLELRTEIVEWLEALA